MKSRSITFEEIEEHRFLWGDILWHKKSGRVSRIGVCGDFADLDFLKRIFDRGGKLEASYFIDWSLVDTLSQDIINLKNAKLEKDRIEIFNKLSKSFDNCLVKGKDNSSLLDWIFVAFKSFYNLPKEYEEAFVNFNLEAFRRAIFLSGLTTWLCLRAGYLDYTFLEKVFNAMLISDFSLLETKYSSYHIEELEKQRRDGRADFESVFLKGTGKHGENISTLLEKITKNSTIKNMVKFHHEILNSAKGPFQVYESEVGDLVSIVSFCERVSAYKSFHYEANDANEFVSKSLDKLDGYNRIRTILGLNKVKEVA